MRTPIWGTKRSLDEDDGVRLVLLSFHSLYCYRITTFTFSQISTLGLAHGVVKDEIAVSHSSPVGQSMTTNKQSSTE